MKYKIIRKHTHLIDKHMYLTEDDHSHWFGKIIPIYCYDVDFLHTIDLP